MPSLTAVDQLIMDPARRTWDDITSNMLGVVDPLYRRYCPAAVTLMDAKLSAMRADLRQTMDGVIESLTHGNARGIVKIAARGDWLFFDAQLAQVLAELVWTGRLLGDDDGSGDTNCETALLNLCRMTGARESLDRVLSPTSLRDQSIALVELMQASLERIHESVGEFHVDTEHWFRWTTFEHRYAEVERTDLTRTETAAQQIATSLAELPACVGVCINGSFAEIDKHDGLNDLDVNCYCTSLPDPASRAEFYARLGLIQTPRTDAFEFIELDSVYTHLTFALVDNQRKATARLRIDGDESACLHFLHPNFALSAYHLERARIVHDPHGVVAELKRATTAYPDAERRRVIDTWTPVWETWGRRFTDAMADADRAHAWIAYRYAAEATLRLALANIGLHANPIEPKWFPHEIAKINGFGELATASFDGSLAERFDALRGLRRAGPE